MRALHGLTALMWLAAACGATAQQAHRVPDTLEQRLQACVPCHGQDGRASPIGYLPRIAGKPAGYLTNQLINFREGRRFNAAMTHLVQHLTDEYLREIGLYFAALEFPYPPPAQAREDQLMFRRGEALVQRGVPGRSVPACTYCHGDAMTGALPAVPGLLGLPRDYLAGQLGAWKAGNRRAAAPDCMAQIAQKLESDEIQAIALWLSSRPVVNAGRPAPRVELPLPIECGSGTR
jgi:cytochrome c553